MKRFAIFGSILAAVVLLAVTVTPALTQPAPLPPAPKASILTDYFTIAVLPDTQFYSQWFPDIFKRQAQWIVNNQATLNIQFVCGLGDIVEHYNNTSQWQNAVAAYNILSNAGVPYSVVSGNHDDGAAHPTQQYFNAYFPTGKFSGYSWYGGYWPGGNGNTTGGNADNYELFSAFGRSQ